MINGAIAGESESAERAASATGGNLADQVQRFRIVSDRAEAQGTLVDPLKSSTFDTPIS